MMDHFRFNWIAFLISFGIGMFYVYMKAPAPKIVITYPTPYNAGNIVYTDSANTCFVFNANRKSCNSVPDKNSIKPQPIVNTEN